jgi:hypothetical protein
MLLVIAGIAWASYEFVYVRGVLRSEPKVFVPREVLDEVRDTILEAYEENVCFLELGPVHYRAREDHYRVEFTVADGCLPKARSMCQDIAHLLRDQVDDSVGVFAYDQAGNPIAKFLD